MRRQRHTQQRVRPVARWIVAATLVATSMSVPVAGAAGADAPPATAASVPSVLASTANGRIAFQSDRDGDFEIFTVNPDGTGMTQVTFNSATDSHPEWSPDGSQIAFESDRDGDFEIYVMNADGSNVRQLTFNSAYDGEPTWSPDGSRIAFDSDRTDGSDIFVTHADGSGGTYVISLTGENVEGAAHWSPDGGTVAFQALATNGWEIETLPVTTKTPAHFVYGVGMDGDSPDGFFSEQDVDWSPDGDWLAFARLCTQCEVLSDFQIAVSQSDGSTVSSITSDTWDHRSPAWSPDQRLIVYEDHQYGSSDTDIVVMDTSGTFIRRLTLSTARDENPDWGPSNGGDQDGDALLDLWEINGLWGWPCYYRAMFCDANPPGLQFIDLPVMGANPSIRDLFVEVDHMSGLAPNPGAIGDVVAAFAARTINLHVDFGTGAPLVGGGTWGAMSEAEQLIRETNLGFEFGDDNYSWAEFDVIRRQHFSPARSKIFRYALFADHLGSTMGATSGIARGIPGSDFIVSLGGWTRTVDQQAGTFMHELGHTLGLWHGGDEDVNHKPNYRSVMNYLFQTVPFTGLAFPDFSDEVLPALDEGSLDEGVGLGGGVIGGTRHVCGHDAQNDPIPRDAAGGAGVDWSCDRRVTPGWSFGLDINGDFGQSTLTGYDDWENLEFAGGAVGGAGVWADSALPADTPIVDDFTFEDHVSVEEALASGPGTGEDVGLVDPATGLWYLRDAGTGAVTSFYFGNPGDVPVMGDWDCDGVDTPGLFRQSDAFAYLRNSNTTGIADTRFFFGNPSDVPLAGDFDGDGCDSLSIYRPSEQRFYIMNRLGENEGGLGAADYSFVFGNPGDKPVVGDWDGDGVDEIGLHRESTGFFYYRNTLTTGFADGEFFYGDPGDRFVAGDWDGNGFQTPAVFRPGGTTFYFRYSLSQGIADDEFALGESGYLPVAGRFDLE